MAYPPAPAPVPQPAPVKQGNGFGVTALVLGIIAIAGFWIPVLNVISIILGALALIFGIVALVVAGNRGGKGKGSGWTGIILGVLAIATSIIWNIVFFNAAGDVLDEEWQQACDDAGLTEEECGDWEDWESYETP
ncbi:hypothetical protein GCM10009830_38090 [Glycomyces endophyticus]|uniref:DUF4190 domain-containing protein n=1 Tax=Glycomyces endophyticus TaxID=480996 RepID=A0ABN2HF71_9ACTN